MSSSRLEHTKSALAYGAHPAVGKTKKSRAPTTTKAAKKKKKKKTNAIAKKTAKTVTPAGPQTRPAGPMWTVPAHEPLDCPELERQLAKPFLQSVYVDPKTQSIRYPLQGVGQQDALLRGLHTCMRYRFFNGQAPPEYVPRAGRPLRKGSSKLEGSRADAALDEAIRTGQAPPGKGKRGASAYATAVWDYWKENGHRPVLSQLPVIFVHAYVATAGDYFTIHTCPLTRRRTLWLWELKTGWPQYEKTPDLMSKPLDHVWLTPENRWLLQLQLTREAYRRELGLEISGEARVINVYHQRPRNDKAAEYECKVRVLGPEHGTPERWTERTDMDTVYAALRKEQPRRRLKTGKKTTGKKKGNA